MRRNHEGKQNNVVGVELKYCEHCGGLWVRERGAGTVYCERCQAKVADLPAPKESEAGWCFRFVAHTTVEDYEFEIDVENLKDLEAAGGVA